VSSDFLIKTADCLKVLDRLPNNSIDAIATDPPYELGFMGKRWDATGVAFNVAVWQECLRVLKPGAHLVAFGGTRTYHRMACAIEDAGFDIRDCLMWLYGTGFPKSHNIGGGCGTALKPACEPIILARKPLDGTIAENVDRWRTGALNIDGCRIAYTDASDKAAANPGRCTSKKHGIAAVPDAGRGDERVEFAHEQKGRWPANLLLDEAAADELDADSGIGASRFFYVVKPSRAEREAGCDDLPEVRRSDGRTTEHHVPNLRTTSRRNHHPTVKPIELMRHLCRLITPRRGIVLDPFCGSGSTGCAAILEGFRFVGIEREPEYADIAKRRISHWAYGQTDTAA
jgi:DNA modification methylase